MPVTQPAAAGAPPLPPEHRRSTTDDEIPRYPPFLKGLPLPPIPRLIATQSDLIARLRRELALGADDDGSDRWESYIAPVIRGYAAFVHLIPASEAHHHSGAGGLYRHGLEAAVLAARASRGVMVGLDRPRSEQRRLEPRLRAAAALGGLLHDAGKAIHDVAATDETGRVTWSPIEADLDDWATRHGLARYFLRWREQRAHGGHAVFNVIALKRILPPQVECWLSAPDPDLYSGLVAAVAGVAHSSALVELVHEADRRSVEQDLREHRIEPIDTAVGVPVDRYLVDAMRRLLHDGRWQVNVPGARVWLLRDLGLHLVWPAAARDITELLATDRVPGIPRDADTIAELLLERGLAVPRVDGLGRHPTWRLAPAPLAREGQKTVSLTMLRLKEPGMLFPFGAPGAVGLAQLSERTNTARSKPALFPAPPMPEQGSADSEDTHQRGNWSEEAGPAAPAAAEQADCVANNGQADNEQEAARDEAHRWLSTASDSTAQLLDHLDSLRVAMDQSVQQREGLLWLRYPAWFETADWRAAEAAQSLSDDGLLEPDPRTPMRRVRDHAGQRWLVLNAEVSGHLGVLLDGSDTSSTESALASGKQVRAAEPLAHAATQPGRETAGEAASSLIESILKDLAARSGQADGGGQVLDHATLKVLAKQHRLGVYSLRERLLTDPRVTEDTHKRLVVTQG
jgi:conjugal transfer pilus assembly protein TraI